MNFWIGVGIGAGAMFVIAIAAFIGFTKIVISMDDSDEHRID